MMDNYFHFTNATVLDANTEPGEIKIAREVFHVMPHRISLRLFNEVNFPEIVRVL